jgi:hypothetical protein
MVSQPPVLQSSPKGHDKQVFFRSYEIFPKDPLASTSVIDALPAEQPQCRLLRELFRQ